MHCPSRQQPSSLSWLRWSERPTDFKLSGSSAGVFADPFVAECIVDTVDFDERPEWTHRRRTCDQWLSMSLWPGSLLIGLTVFAVISIVNFMVITKGLGPYGRGVARSHQSLPGKQLAIDGDLNSGAIDHEEAKRRRVREQREISFFGSLDGASKFVKGDAIAGLCRSR